MSRFLHKKNKILPTTVFSFSELVIATAITGIVIIVISVIDTRPKTLPEDWKSHYFKYREYKTSGNLHAKLSRFIGLIDDEFGYRTIYYGKNFIDPICFLAFTSFFITIERFVALMWIFVSIKIFRNTKYSEITKDLKENIITDVQIAIEKCQRSNNVLANVLNAGLLKYDKGFCEVERCIEDRIVIEKSKIRKRLWILEILVYMELVLGILGTISSVFIGANIHIFGESIKTALISINIGILIAIPLYLIYNFFIAWVDIIVVKIEKDSYIFVEILKESNLKV